MGQEKDNWLFKLRNDIVDFVFEAEERRVAAVCANLALRNIELGARGQAFFHGGVLFTAVAKGTGNAEKGVLLPELQPKADALVKELGLLKLERDRVAMALTVVLRRCENAQDVRDALPNSLRESATMLKGLPRTREEAWTVKGDERAERQYRKLRELIEIYNTVRLVA